MSLKSGVIAAAAVAVVGFALYLFMEVRATPAQAQATQVSARPRPRPEPRPAPAPAAPEPTPVKAAPAPPGAWWKDNPRLEPRPGTEVDGPPLPTMPSENKVNVKLDNMMELANKAYDSQDFDQATAIAMKVLAKDPNNVRMLRIIVSANCIQGDSVIAQTHYEKLPPFDREQMRARCDRYGVSFKEPL